MDWMTEPIYRNLDIYWQSRTFWMQFFLSCLTLGALLLSLYSAWQSRKSVQIAKEALNHEKETFKKLHEPDITVEMHALGDFVDYSARKEYKINIHIYIVNKGHTIEYPILSSLEFNDASMRDNQYYLRANDNPKFFKNSKLLPGKQLNYYCDFYLKEIENDKFCISLIGNSEDGEVVSSDFFSQDVKCTLFFARGFQYENNSLGNLEGVLESFFRWKNYQSRQFQGETHGEE